MKVRPPQSGQREGVPMAHDKSKWRTSSSLEAGPIGQSMGESLLVAEAFLWHQVKGLEQLLAICEEEVCRIGEDQDAMWREQDKVWGDRDTAWRDKDVAVETAMEQLAQLQEMQAHLRQREAQAEVAAQWLKEAEVWGAQGGGPSIEVPRVMAERAWRQEEWLTNEAALGWQGAKEHYILLNRALAVLGSIHDGLVRMPEDLLPELEQRVMQMEHLLAGHQQRVMADPRAWWKVVTDVGEPLLGHPNVLAIVVTQLEVDMVRRIAEVEPEGEEE
ncbi:hypothetical protein E4T56_gene6833 [Termitomyces sp. T112]|nr:hypothetical protein E4T56_gene6833 [Termitomyces sp. T112]